MSAPDGHATRWANRSERLSASQQNYLEVMTFPGPDTTFAYYDAGVVGFVFA